MMLFLLTACEYEWPYEVVPQEETMAGFAECFLSKGQERLSPEVLLGGVELYIEGDGKVLYELNYPDGAHDWCLFPTGTVELRRPDLPEWTGSCGANYEWDEWGEHKLFDPIDPYKCSALDVTRQFHGGPITEWALDSVDFELRSGARYLLTAEGVKGEWTLPEGALDGVPEGRALYAAEYFDEPAVVIIDGVTGELVYDGEATRR